MGGVGGHQVEHLAGARRRIRSAALQHHTDAGAQLGVVDDGIQAEDLDLAGVGLDEALAHLHRCRLTGPVGSEERQHLGGLDVEVELGHRGRRSVPLADPAQRHGRSRQGGHGDSA